MADKYNYATALELLKDAYNANVKVTYIDLENALGLEHPIDDKKYISTNNYILHELRKRLKNQHGLTFKSAANGNHSSPEYYYYIVSKVKDGNFKKKNNEETVKIAQEKIKNDQYEALSKNNQKLYAELEQEKAANAVLRENNIRLKEREQEYKNIIQSLYNLLNT